MPWKGEQMNTKTKTVDVEQTNTTMEKSDGGSITGYAATWTREPDSYGDVIAKGAFAESIAAIEESGKAIPLLWNHNGGDLSAYIGTVTELSEDGHGLLFTATFDDTPDAQRARELAQDGRLAKFSFAYDVLDQETVELDDGTEANELRKLNIHEVSLVLYPANRDTSVVEVKSDAPAQVGCSLQIADEQCVERITRSLIDSIEKKHRAAAEKAGRRNSKADEGELNAILDHLSAIQSIVNGLLAGSREEPDEQEEETEAGKAEANAEEPDTANAEEPSAKAAEVEGLLQQATEILGKEGRDDS